MTIAIAGRSDNERPTGDAVQQEQDFLRRHHGRSISRNGQPPVSADRWSVHGATRGVRHVRAEDRFANCIRARGLPRHTRPFLPRDPGDNLPANGSAFKLKLNVQAGDEISFDWMFDATVTRRPPTTTPSSPSLEAPVPSCSSYRTRQTGDHGASGWRSSIYTASTTGELTIGFGAVNDRVADASSVLLVDNVRFNRDFDQGYQSSIIRRMAGSRPLSP